MISTCIHRQSQQPARAASRECPLGTAAQHLQGRDTLGCWLSPSLTGRDTPYLPLSRQLPVSFTPGQSFSRRWTTLQIFYLHTLLGFCSPKAVGGPKLHVLPSRTSLLGLPPQTSCPPTTAIGRPEMESKAPVLLFNSLGGWPTAPHN